MKLDIKIESMNYTIEWKKKLEDFPKVISYWIMYYEWSFYDKSESPGIDYELIFTELHHTDSRANSTATDFFSILNNKSTCECGSKTMGHPGHSSWCPEDRR